MLVLIVDVAAKHLHDLRIARHHHHLALVFAGERNGATQVGLAEPVLVENERNLFAQIFCHKLAQIIDKGRGKA